MFSITISEKGGETQRLEFEGPEVTIGRVQGNDIVLPKGNVSKRHSRIVLKDGKFIIVDLKSTNGTYVNGRKIMSPIVVKGSDKVYIGDFVLTIDDGTRDAALDESRSDTAPPAARRPTGVLPPPPPTSGPVGDQRTIGLEAVEEVTPGEPADLRPSPASAQGGEPVPPAPAVVAAPEPPAARAVHRATMMGDGGLRPVGLPPLARPAPLGGTAGVPPVSRPAALGQTLAHAPKMAEQRPIPPAAAPAAAPAPASTPTLMAEAPSLPTEAAPPPVEVVAEPPTASMADDATPVPGHFPASFADEVHEAAHADAAATPGPTMALPAVALPPLDPPPPVAPPAPVAPPVMAAEAQPLVPPSPGVPAVARIAEVAAVAPQLPVSVATPPLAHVPAAGLAPGLARLVEQGVLSVEMAALLELAVRARRAVLLVGDTESRGILARSLAEATPGEETWISLRAADQGSRGSRISARPASDEAREANRVLVDVSARALRALVAHPGSLITGPGLSAADGVRRFAQLSRLDGSTDARLLAEILEANVFLVSYLSASDGQARIRQLAQLKQVDDRGHATLVDLYDWNEAHGQFRATGQLPDFAPIQGKA